MEIKQPKPKPLWRHHIEVTDSIAKGVICLAELRLLTTAQFAKTTGLSPNHAGEILRRLEFYKYVAAVGDMPIPGRGRAPKIWHLTQKGHAYFEDIANLRLSTYVHAKPQRAWSQTMPHRLAIVDFYLSLRLALYETNIAQIENAAFDFRYEFLGDNKQKETTDVLDRKKSKKIIPDAAFHVVTADNLEALFFLEMNMGTELIDPSTSTNTTIHKKLSAYQAYLKSGAFATKYAHWGQFAAFQLLFVTTTQARIEKIIASLQGQHSALRSYLLFATKEDAISEPLDQIWRDGFSKEATLLS